MTIAAGADTHGKGVSGGHLSLYFIAGVIAWARQVAIDALDTAHSVVVDRVGGILDLILVTTGAEGVGRIGSACSLRLDLVAIGASAPGLAVVTG